MDVARLKKMLAHIRKTSAVHLILGHVEWANIALATSRQDASASHVQMAQDQYQI